MQKRTAKKQPTAITEPALGADKRAELKARAARLDLTKLNDYERSYLAACQEVYRRLYTSGSPFDDFLTSLVLAAQHHGPLTPDEVAQKLENFRGCWESMKESVQAFIKAYPDAVTVEKAEVEHAA
jgi:hypothetical protein